ncbi:type II secretion system protein GspG [Pyxidicoccus sp. QH1ED-7-1]|nr:type II secretion system protein GspG [Pyxidicoccus xibeiensis]
MDAGFLEVAPQDPWEHDYIYRLEGGLPVLRSYGEDGAPGGDGIDADIVVRTSPPAVGEPLQGGVPSPATAP